MPNVSYTERYGQFKEKKRHNRINQTRKPSDFWCITTEDKIEKTHKKSGDQRPLKKRGETEKPYE